MNGVVLSPTLPAVQGDRAIFNCDADYELIGATSSTCQENGQWSSSPPTCELIQCPELHNPGNGTVSISLQDRRVGSTATFQCNFGYQLSGQASVLCQQNRQWSAQSPACQLIQCPSLSNPLNGVVQVNNREAVYTCSEGYRMVGVERRLCQLGGVWSGQPPTCDEIQCPMLNNPLNGRVEFTSRAVGSTAQYTCNTGYHLIGVASVICELPTGQWTNTPPTCELIDCGVPDIPRNGYVSLPSGGTHLNNYAHYYCNTGYTVQGSEQRRCQENGLWSGNMPGCLAIDCGPAPALLHGEVTTNSTLLHGVATYNCTTGYRLTSGSSNLVCADTGLWTGTPPSCSVVTCSRLTPPENGNVFWDSTEFNSTASYTCRDGFLLSGVSVRVCQANGFWSNRPPVCSRIPPVSTTSLSEFYPQPSLLTSTSTTTTQLATPNSDDLRASPNNDFTTSPYATHSNSVPALSNVPTFTDSKPSDKNVFIVCGMIVVMLILISLVVVLIIVVYLRRRKMNTLAAAAANSVENPLYSGHGNTPLATLNCFRMGNGCKPCKSPNSGFEMQEFGFQSMAGSEEDKFGVSTAVHLYDFPTLHNSEEKHGVYEHYEEAGGVGHSYEFPDHYHLPTQYEVPVSPYERPKPQARLHIYKNTLQEDVDVPTSDERRKSVSVERQIKRQVSWKTNSSVSQSVADENPFLESSTYWRPASDPASLYEQLAQNKYREIIRKYIKVTEVLGSGQFGQVHRGIWQRSGGAMDVAIKTLKEGAVEEDKVRFLQEAAVSGQFQHPNVVRLQGVVTVGEPIMIILELLPNGDLRNYLQKQRPATGEVLGDHWPQQLLHFSRDIASGMNYLSSKAFVHRDLAARNILVAEDRTCKIGDFGMSRDLDEENYYISNGGKIPVKWTAPEALHYKKYSTASDVWSFGIVMFEIWSLGHKPFEKHSNTETIKMTDQGLRLPPPPGCPRAIYQLMIQCWHPAHTASRPTFHALVHALSRDSTRLLHWSKGDSEAHPQAAVLGAPLEAGLDLYVDLQRTYIPSTVTSS